MSTEMNKEILLSRLSKLRALVDKGYGGEKINAETLLHKLMDKYKIQEEDLLDDTVSEHEFQYHGHLGKKLFTQITYSILGKDYNVKHYVHKRNCKTLFVDCTDSQAIEIKETFEFYRYHLDEGFESYLRAFIQVEKIFPSDDSPKDMSYEEYLEYLKSDEYKLQNGMSKHDRHLMLED